MATLTLVIALFLTFVLRISAHGHVTGIVANGAYYMGYTPNFVVSSPQGTLKLMS